MTLNGRVLFLPLNDKVIRRVRNTGRSVDLHINYEIKKNGKNVDPEDYFSPWMNK
ncbi:MAG: hypothetical protein K9H64_13335 [Bacteroidales bacterium]|nr:hypothetical protein [Bacteroidales bacterium]MCF8456992.1 hypothetical protein [Bacteroidales bacterium]